jgi:hypothetical protein
MKGNKILILIILSIIILIPSVSAINIDKNILCKSEKLLSDPPDWATHYFYGIIGQTNQNGKPQEYKAVTAGYCQDEFKGRFAGFIAEKNDEKNPEYFIGGKIAGSFLIGIAGNISTEKYTGIVGIGFRNETHFYFRLMAIVGPTIYIAGKYIPI